jgi:hypothetical protein
VSNLLSFNASSGLSGLILSEFGLGYPGDSRVWDLKMFASGEGDNCISLINGF